MLILVLCASHSVREDLYHLFARIPLVSFMFFFFLSGSAIIEAVGSKSEILNNNETVDMQSIWYKTFYLPRGSMETCWGFQSSSEIILVNLSVSVTYFVYPMQINAPRKKRRHRGKSLNHMIVSCSLTKSFLCEFKWI